VASFESIGDRRLIADPFLVVDVAQQDKFAKMMAILPDIHAMSSRGEEYLYFKHLNGCAPTQTLLMEMLHAKRK